MTIEHCIFKWVVTIMNLEPKCGREAEVLKKAEAAMTRFAALAGALLSKFDH